MSDKFAEALDITPNQQVATSTAAPLPIVQEEESAPIVIPENPDAVDDYKLSRKTYRDLIAKGSLALDNITDLAKDLESPRAYEVLATMMRTVSDVTRDLYDLQKKSKELKAPEAKRVDETNITVDKAVFVGTTAELLQKLKYDTPKTIDG